MSTKSRCTEQGAFGLHCLCSLFIKTCAQTCQCIWVHKALSTLCPDHFSSQKQYKLGTFLAVWWGRLHASNQGSVPGQGVKIPHTVHMAKKTHTHTHTHNKLERTQVIILSNKEQPGKLPEPPKLFFFFNSYKQKQL